MTKIEYRTGLLLAILYVSFLAPVEAESYRIIPESFLMIGNHWEYQVRITKEENVVVDLRETVAWDVTKTEPISGFNTTVIEGTSPTYPDEISLMYWMLSLEYLSEVRWEEADGSEYELETVRNNDPWEILPVSVSDTDNDRYLGRGQYSGEYGTLQPRSIEGTWTGYTDHFITYLRQESITVPAGTFNCVVVLLKSEWHDIGGWKGDTNSTLWMSSDVGIVKIEEVDREWDPWNKVWYEDVSTAELKLTNLQPPPEKRAMPWLPLLLDE